VYLVTLFAILGWFAVQVFRNMLVLLADQR
jgi:hypothetical protein